MIISRLLVAAPRHRLGAVVHGFSAGGASGPVGDNWSARLAQARAGRVPPENCGRTPRRRGTKRKTTGGRVEAAIQNDPIADTPELDDDIGSDVGPRKAGPAAVPPRVHRRARLHEPILVEDFMQEALTACVKRCCGVASTLPMRRFESPVSARVVGDPNGGSRAIDVRSGSSKLDIAILWVSARGGVLCSCFGGTQNAMLLSASSRSTKCCHTAALSKALATSSVSHDEFNRRMRLRADAKDFTIHEVRNASSVIWAVLYHSVFSVVTFSAANVALCVAPSCRRFRGRCGHVREARSHIGPDGFNDAIFGSSLKAVKARKELKKPASRVRARVINNEEEDEGVDSLPSDTVRAPQDADEGSVSARTKRNMLPCSSEVDQEEGWNRTADWRTLFMRRRASSTSGNRAFLRQVGQYYLALTSMGATRDVRAPLIEPFCGDCGQQRTESHKVERERAILTTSQATAFPIKVR